MISSIFNTPLGYVLQQNLGKIRAGETILIHAAAGGVGQAAIQLAHLFGAEVYATVGTRDKREFIEQELGIASHFLLRMGQLPDSISRYIGVKPDHIMNSRNLDFVNEILQKTNGKGVDLVLNSLSGDALKKSVTVLAPFGRCIKLLPGLGLI